MFSRLHRHLYIRIWAAVAVALAALTLTVGWLWKVQWEHERAQRPGRELVVRNEAGDWVGRALARPVPGQPPEFWVTLADGTTLRMQLPRPPRPPLSRFGPWPGMQSTTGFVVLLLAVTLAVTLCVYPVIRRLTQRLEGLQKGVARWGEGDLSTRLQVQGEDEVAFLAQRFNQAADRVESLVRAHKSLLANASHELRSPLARIRMGLALLGPADGGHAERYREIERNIQELDDLIGEILLASRLDLSPDTTGALSLSEVDLLALAVEEGARAGASLEVHGEPAAMLVEGDHKLLRRLLRNLLENARRHGGEQAAQLTVTACTGDTPGVEWRVADRGPGVPSEYRERIFEPFFRLPGASERDGGVGLGLALVRTIAERHGGSVRCEDNPDGGAVFRVFLPAGADRGP